MVILFAYTSQQRADKIQNESQTSGLSRDEYTSSIRKPARDQALGAGSSTGSKVQSAAFGMMMSGGDDDESNIEAVNTPSKAGKLGAGKSDHSNLKFVFVVAFIHVLILAVHRSLLV